MTSLSSVEGSQVSLPPAVLVDLLRGEAPVLVHSNGPASVAWEGDRYVWVSGHWERRHHAGAVWVDGQWKHDRDGWYWVEGHWR